MITYINGSLILLLYGGDHANVCAKVGNPVFRPNVPFFVFSPPTLTHVTTHS
jgi:hypothetical protein